MIADPSKIPADKPLTPKQERFVLEYLVDFNASQAALRAGYSPFTARRIGSENLAKPPIIAAIRRKQEKMAGKLEITAEKVLQEHARIAFYNILDLFNPDGTLKPLDEIPPELGRAIHGIEIVDGPQGVTIKRVKMLSKDKALDALSKHLGLFEKDNQQHGEAGMKTAQEFMTELFAATNSTPRGLHPPRKQIEGPADD